eukprot:3681150-Pleurochrysis_carterae.AAC.2
MVAGGRWWHARIRHLDAGMKRLAKRGDQRTKAARPVRTRWKIGRLHNRSYVEKQETIKAHMLTLLNKRCGTAWLPLKIQVGTFRRRFEALAARASNSAAGTNAALRKRRGMRIDKGMRASTVNTERLCVLDEFRILAIQNGSVASSRLIRGRAVRVQATRLHSFVRRRRWRWWWRPEPRPARSGSERRLRRGRACARKRARVSTCFACQRLSVCACARTCARARVRVRLSARAHSLARARVRACARALLHARARACECARACASAFAHVSEDGEAELRRRIDDEDHRQHVLSTKRDLRPKRPARAHYEWTSLVRIG